jgi:hypothetical protein
VLNKSEFKSFMVATMKLSGTLPGMIEALTSDDIVEETFTWTDQDKSGALTWAEVW